MTGLQPDAGSGGSTAPQTPGQVDSEVDPLVVQQEVRPNIAALLIDDNPADRLIADRLSSSGLPTEALTPNGTLESLRNEVLQRSDQGDCDVVLLDYRLDDRENGDGTTFAHRAGSLAAELKEQRASLPLVLMTTEANLRSWVESNHAIAPLFDLMVLKSDLATEESRLRHAIGISDLAFGYRVLAQVAASPLDWATVAMTLGLDGREAQTFAEEWPDPVPSNLSDLVAAILKGLLAERPGPLLPFADAAGRLGVTQSSLPEVRRLLPHLDYKGPFCLMRPRIWRNRLDAAVHELTSDSDGSPSAARVAFEAIEEARCRVCGERRSTKACVLCREGIDERHYVVASELITPAWSEPRAVCFACIEDGTADDERFTSSSRALVDRLRAGEGWQR